MFISPDPTTPDAKNPTDYEKYLYTRGNPLRFIDTAGYAAEDYYIYVNGCLSSGDACPNKEWGEYLDLLRTLFDQGGWGFIESPSGSIHKTTFEQWAFQRDGGHVRFIGAPGLSGDQVGADTIQRELEKIHGDGLIHLTGHSMGGAAIAEYFARAKYAAEHPILGALNGYKTLDPRIRDATLIDPFVNEAALNQLGDWAGEQGVNLKAFDTQGDGVGGCSNVSNYCEPNPDYSVDLSGSQRITDLAPTGTRWAPDQSSKDLHAYTFTHAAKQTQEWLRILWR